MTNRYIVYDVETPNRKNNRMSAIGITIIEQNQIVDSLYTLVNPETYFNAFNIDLTGIAPNDVLHAPTFPLLWKRISPLFNSGILVAHNAPFDLRVLSSCLSDYHIPWKQEVSFACTRKMGHACFPGLPNYKLNTLCDAFHIDLHHHSADSDSLACAQLLLLYQKQGFPIETYIQTYDMIHQKTLRRKRGSKWQK